MSAVETSLRVTSQGAGDHAPWPLANEPASDMSVYDEGYEPDDDSEDDADRVDADTMVWQLLLLINPGDEESALQQLGDYQELSADLDEESLQAMPFVAQAIDWRAGFQLDENDTSALVQVIDELTARFNLSIDWLGDADEDEFHQQQDAATLFGIAYDRLAEAGYTLWSWEAEPGTVAGWITLTDDSEAMREIATVLQINLRLGCDLT